MTLVDEAQASHAIEREAARERAARTREAAVNAARERFVNTFGEEPEKIEAVNAEYPGKTPRKPRLPAYSTAKCAGSTRPSSSSAATWIPSTISIFT